MAGADIDSDGHGSPRGIVKQAAGVAQVPTVTPCELALPVRDVDGQAEEQREILEMLGSLVRDGGRRARLEQHRAEPFRHGNDPRRLIRGPDRYRRRTSDGSPPAGHRDRAGRGNGSAIGPLRVIDRYLPMHRPGR